MQRPERVGSAIVALQRRAGYDAAAYAAAAAAARDDSLGSYAEWVVEILIDLKAPGCEWLDLVPRDAA